MSSCLVFPWGSVLQRDKVDTHVEVNLPPSSNLPTVEEGKQYYFFNLARPRVGRWYSIIFSLTRPRDSSFTPSLLPRVPTIPRQEDERPPLSPLSTFYPSIHHHPVCGSLQTGWLPPWLCQQSPAFLLHCSRRPSAWLLFPLSITLTAHP